MAEKDLQTFQLLERWHEGDGKALNEILQRDLPWIRERVHHRLGDKLRAKEETQDFVQDAMVEVLRYGPRFLMSNRQHFRALMARIIENVLRGRHDWFQAERRRMDREAPLPSDTMLVLDPANASVTRPSQAVERNEHQAWVRMSLELLDPDDREIILMRQWREMSFGEIAEQLSISEDASRMRFNRALPRLVKKIKQLKGGELAAILGGPSEDV